MNAPPPECSSCGCNDVRVLRSEQNNARQCRDHKFVEVKLIVSRLQCNHCGHRWTERSVKEKEKKTTRQATRLD
jgi:uncharacterized Zn finger protein